MKKYLPVLKHCPFFAGMDEGEILSILNCVDAKIRTFDHDEYIFRAGDSTASMGLILSGSVLVIQEDLWGAPEYHVQNRSRRLLCGTLRRNARFRFEHQRGNRRPSETLMLNINRLLTVCPTACTHHNRLIRNLVSVLAEKVLQFNEKITHMSKRTTREKLLSYLSSESIRQGSLSSLTFPMTGSSWRTICAWNAPPCRQNCRNSRRKGFSLRRRIILSWRWNYNEFFPPPHKNFCLR